MLYRVHVAWAGFDLTTLVVIGTVFMNVHREDFNQIQQKYNLSQLKVMNIHESVYLLSSRRLSTSFEE